MSSAPSCRRIVSSRTDAGHDQVGAAGFQAGHAQPLGQRQRRGFFPHAADVLGRNPQVADLVGLLAEHLVGGHRAQAQDRARRADDAVVAGAHDGLGVGARSPRGCASPARRSSRSLSGSLFTNRSVSRMTPTLKLLASCGFSPPQRDLDAAAADVDDHGLAALRRRRRRRPPGGSAALPRCRK